MLEISAKVVADSVSEDGVRLTTMQLCYPRFIHSELMTHRAFSRNAMSSRAVPVAKMIEQVRKNPAMPVHWGKNRPGMQADAEMQGSERTWAITLWEVAAHNAARLAEEMNDLGLHKQVVNRILEPYQWMHTIVSFTEWDNFDQLRNHPAAEPTFQVLAGCMRNARNASTPRVLRPGFWHVPYVEWEESAGTFLRGEIKLGQQVFIQPTSGGKEWYPLSLADALKCSAARCARVSYNKHDGTPPEPKEDAELYERLVGSVPRHASPVEHQATPCDDDRYDPNWSGNFRGWIQHRKVIEMGFDVSALRA